MQANIVLIVLSYLDAKGSNRFFFFIEKSNDYPNNFIERRKYKQIQNIKGKLPRYIQNMSFCCTKFPRTRFRVEVSAERLSPPPAPATRDESNERSFWAMLAAALLSLSRKLPSMGHFFTSAVSIDGMGRAATKTAQVHLLPRPIERRSTHFPPFSGYQFQWAELLYVTRHTGM